MSEPILCFVDGPWAYFTPRPLSEQGGDDWDDAPYEHNGDPPYEDDITVVAYRCDLEEPSFGHCNSPYSVDSINAGAVAWLRSPSYVKGDKAIVIPAGTTLARFTELIRQAGGDVFARLP